MIVALDLDDTLYPEETFVESGFRAVAHALAERWGVDEGEAFDVMWRSLEERGRGSQFDDVVTHFGVRQSVPELVRVYRHHRPAISLPEELAPRAGGAAPAAAIRGHRRPQGRPAEQDRRPRDRPLLSHAYVTHRYGIAHRKPSTRVFELMLRRERCAPSDLVYVGDDPAKDFRGIRPLGIHTIRVLTGRHSVVEVAAEHDAELTVSGMADVPAAVEGLEAA